MPRATVAVFESRLKKPDCSPRLRAVVNYLRRVAESAVPEPEVRAHLSPSGGWGISYLRSGRVYCRLDPKSSADYVGILIPGAKPEILATAGTVHRRKDAEPWTHIFGVRNARLLATEILSAHARLGQKQSGRPTTLAQSDQQVMVPVSAKVKEMLSRPVRGSGGFQSVLRRLQARFVDGRTLCLSNEDVDRMRKLVQGYRQGGFQDRLREILLAVDRGHRKDAKTAGTRRLGRATKAPVTEGSQASGMSSGPLKLQMGMREIKIG